MKHFIYKDENTPEIVHSFVMEKVLRSIGLPDGKRVVLLDDTHEAFVDVEQKNKAGKVIGIIQRRDSVRSEILLSKEDSEKFIQALND